MQAGSPSTVHVGDSIVMYAGCDHSMINSYAFGATTGFTPVATSTCRDKFFNVVNFGGAPHIVSADWFFSSNLNNAKGNQ